MSSLTVQQFLAGERAASPPPAGLTVELGLAALAESEGLRLPFGAPARAWALPAPSAAAWAAQPWNPPPGHAQDGEADPSASPKPSLERVEAAAAAAWDRQHADSWRAALRGAARRAITAAYGEASVRDETLLRLRGGHTGAQDAERDRIRAGYRLIAAMAADERGAAGWPPPADVLRSVLGWFPSS